MKISFLQTADAVVYADMLDITARTFRAFAARSGACYESYVGIFRGYHSWQATYNRIPLLKRIVDNQQTGWIVYADADAYIIDLDYDFQEFLSSCAGYALVGTHSGIVPRKWWDVNAGVIALNLDHPLTSRVIYGWYSSFCAITDEEMQNAVCWDQITNDQNLLHEVLESLSQYRSSFLIASEPPFVLNHGEASFIRQALRVTGDMPTRLTNISESVTAVLKQQVNRPPAAKSGYEEEFITALYRTLLLREPDAAGLESNVSRLKSQHWTFSGEIIGCLASREFQQKLHQFVQSYG